MRIPREPVLEISSRGKSQTREPIAWPRNSFQLVENLAGLWGELDQEPFLALLHMHFRCGVYKAEASRFIHNFRNPAQVERPKAERVRFHRDNLSRRNQDLRVRNSHPAQIEHGPLLKGQSCRGKHLVAVSYFCLLEVMCEAKRKAGRRGQSMTQCEQWRRGRGQPCSGRNLLLDHGRRWSVEGEHTLSMPPAVPGPCRRREGQR